MKFITYFIFSLASFLLTFSLISFYLQPLSGDLTRLGKLAERDFGANFPQQSYWVRAIDDPADSNLIIIGDSFSVSNIWQSYLYDQTGTKSSVFGFGSEECLAPRIINFIKHISINYPHIKEIIIESVERSVVTRFKESGKEGCNNAFVLPSPANHGAIEGHMVSGNRSHKILDLNTDLVYLISAFIEHLKGGADNTWQRGSAMMTPLNTAELFSNHLSNFLLFYYGDTIKSSWSEHDLQKVAINLKAINNAANENNIKIYYLIVPDKSSIYKDNFKRQVAPLKTNINLIKVLDAKKINHINLTPRFLSESIKTKDFYLPNDTHLSLYGYKTMAEEVAAHLSKQ